MIGAAPCHAAALAAIHAASFSAAEAWDEAFFAAQLRRPGTFGLLHPAGGLLLGRVAADQAELLTFAVTPESRRRGIGRALLAAALAGAAARGARVMFLEVSAANPAGLALYEAAGFRRLGRRRRYYEDGTDAIVLKRLL